MPISGIYLQRNLWLKYFFSEKLLQATCRSVEMYGVLINVQRRTGCKKSRRQGLFDVRRQISALHIDLVGDVCMVCDHQTSVATFSVKSITFISVKTTQIIAI